MDLFPCEPLFYLTALCIHTNTFVNLVLFDIIYAYYDEILFLNTSHSDYMKTRGAVQS